MRLNKLRIKDKQIYLDDFEVQGVKSFGLSADTTGGAIMVISLHVDLSDVEVNADTITCKFIGDR